MSTFIAHNLVLQSWFACTSPEKSTPQPEDSGITEEEEILGYVPTETDEGWILGVTEPCDSPMDSVQYADVSTQFGFDDETYFIYNIEGAVALQEYDGDYWIWQIGTEGPYARNALGQQISLGSASVNVRLYVMDLNADGEDDLILLGEYFEVIWSVLTPNEHSELFLDFEPSRGVRDVGQIDIDGDGDQDLWALIGSGGLDHHDGWGYIFENLNNEGFSEPYEYLDREYFGASFDGIVLDWDGDLDPDLYVCNDFGFLWGGNHVLINDSGTFTHGSTEQVNGADIVTACMGASVADMDMDDRLDIYMTATAGQHFLKGTADGYVEYTDVYGFPIAQNEQMLWGAQITDYNNDGLLDIFTATSGFTRITQDGTIVQDYPMWMIEQQPDHSYREVGQSLGLEQVSASRAVLTPDLNKDGIVDLIVSDAKRSAYVYMSQGCTAENWIEISGPANSIVRVVAGEQQWSIHLSNTPGMAASMSSTVHIGLGDIETVDWIVLEIPWIGRRSLLGPIDSRQRISFVEPQ